MAESMISVVTEKFIALLQKQASCHVNFVGGAEKKVSSLANELVKVRNMLDDAERRGHGDESIEFSLSRLEQTSYEVEDVLDEWIHALIKVKIEQQYQSGDAAVAPIEKVCSFIPSSSCLRFKKAAALPRGIAKKITDVNAKLDEVLMEKDRCIFVKSQPFYFPSNISWLMRISCYGSGSEVVHGREFDRDILVSKLICRKEKVGIQVVSIVGDDQGIEKTTLAELVYNDSRVEKCFDLRIWISVSDSCDLADIAREILESVRKGSSSNTTRLDEDVKESISGKRFLLVLDGVEDQVFRNWKMANYLEYCDAGSNILITTRNQNAVDITEEDFHCIGKLTDEECWLLLSDEAFSGRNREMVEAFKEVGEEIARNCKGSPLIAHFLGRLLQSKSSLEDWVEVLNNGISKLVVAESYLFPNYWSSCYDESYPMLKRCFSYCAVFPKGSEIVVEDLIGNWMALGYLGSDTKDMELKGRRCFASLAYSLLQDFERDGFNGEIKSCKMPDIVHDFIQYLRKIGRFNDGRLNTTTCGACDPLIISTTTEFFSLLFGYFDDAHRHLCDCLKRLRVLSVPMKNGLPRGMENLIHLRWLKLDGNHLSDEGLKTIFELFNLQTLLLGNCKLKEIPSKIANLVQLRRLDLRDNPDLKELPKSMGRLRELRKLNVRNCPRLIRLPKEMQRLKHLEEEFSFGVDSLCNLGLFKNLFIITGRLRLRIGLSDDCLEDVVKSAGEAELREKRNVQDLVLEFEDEMKKDEGSSERRLDLINALEPDPDPELRNLEIRSYNGPNLPAWILSPGLNCLRQLRIMNCDYITSLLPLAKLPCLEEIEMLSMYGLQSVGPEFLGITTATNSTVAFPKLEKLTFRRCPNWKEWEDITVKQEESRALSLMPCLTHLTLKICTGLTELPHRLLRKARSLEVLDISYSEKLQRRYGDKDTSVGISIFRNPQLQIKCMS